MRGSRGRPESLWIFLLAVSLSGCGHAPANPQGRSVHSAPAGEIGSQMPDFSVRGLRGEEISSADLRGKVVLVDFWATWCQPCAKEMPGYQKLLDRYGARGFKVVGFKFDTMADSEDPIQFSQKLGVRYPLAVATEDLKQKFGGIPGLPTTMLYDRRGILRWKIIGFEYTDAVESALKPLL